MSAQVAVTRKHRTRHWQLAYKQHTLHAAHLTVLWRCPEDVACRAMIRVQKIKI